ncbi:hypothetical protein KKF32_01925 [Patescibacteria group bacterium]|nr:hypothetical protein [Patescibacteria group bacterium]
MKRILLILFVTLGWILTVSAAGIAVTPTKLFFQSEVKSSKTQTLTVKNISPSPLIYNLYSDELTDQIVIQPQSLRLDPTESQRVEITIKPRYTGVYITNISILAQNLDKREFNAIAAIKVPLEMRVFPKEGSFLSKMYLWFIISFTALVILLIIFIIISKRKKRSFWQKVGQAVNLLDHHKKPWWKKFI